MNMPNLLLIRDYNSKVFKQLSPVFAMEEEKEPEKTEKPEIEPYKKDLDALIGELPLDDCSKVGKILIDYNSIDKLRDYYRLQLSITPSNKSDEKVFYYNKNSMQLINIVMQDYTKKDDVIKKIAEKIESFGREYSNV